MTFTSIKLSFQEGELECSKSLPFILPTKKSVLIFFHFFCLIPFSPSREAVKLTKIILSTIKTLFFHIQMFTQQPASKVFQFFPHFCGRVTCVTDAKPSLNRVSRLWVKEPPAFCTDECYHLTQRYVDSPAGPRPTDLFTHKRENLISSGCIEGCVRSMCMVQKMIFPVAGKIALGIKQLQMHFNICILTRCNYHSKNRYRWTKMEIFTNMKWLQNVLLKIRVVGAFCFIKPIQSQQETAAGFTQGCPSSIYSRHR